MAFVATALSDGGLDRSQSLGPNKMQLMTWAVVTGDVSGTITSPSLSVIHQVILSGGLSLTSAPTYAGNVATLAFADPAATVVGTVICIGI